MFKKVTFVVVFLFVSSTTMLIGAEFILKWIFPQPLGAPLFSYDTELGMVPVPNQVSVRQFPGDPLYVTSNDGWGHRLLGINNVDLRLVSALEKNQRNDKSEDYANTVLFIGDSFTYGIGVNDNETFSALFWANYLKPLAQRQKRPLSVINAGNSGVGTDYALKYLLSRGQKVNSRIVVLSFFANDYADNEGWRYFDRIEHNDGTKTDVTLLPRAIEDSFGYYKKKSALASLPLYVWFAERSHLLSLVRRSSAFLSSSHDYKNLVRIFQSRPDADILARGVSSVTSVATTKLILSQIKKYCDQNRIKLVLAYIPSHVDVEKYRAKQNRQDEAQFLQIANDLGLPVVSHTEALAQSPYETKKLYLNDGHWTALAHDLAAAGLIKYFKKYEQKLF